MPLFSFDAIEISPLPIVAGHAFNVSMKVTNTGPVAGTYKADLTINGNVTDNRTLYLEPGMTDSVVFPVNLPTPGQYVVKIGPQSKEIIADFNRVPLTIKIDSGDVDGCDTLAGSTSEPGNMVQMVEGNFLKLTAPANGFEINNIEVFGYIKSSDHDYNSSNIVGGPGTWTYGADIAAIEPVNPNFTINVYDSNKKRLFSGDFSKNLFTYDPQWVSVPLPGVSVSGDFYIELVTHNQSKLYGLGPGDYDYWRRYVVHTWYYQLCIGYENAIDVQSWVSRNAIELPDHYLTYNWLMRADGYQLR